MHCAFLTPSFSHPLRARARPSTSRSSPRAPRPPNVCRQLTHAVTATPAVTDLNDDAHHTALPHADESQSVIQQLADIDELLALADEFDLRDLRVVHHGVCVEISRDGGLGFEQGRLAKPPADAAAAARVVVAADGVRAHAAGAAATARDGVLDASSDAAGALRAEQQQRADVNAPQQMDEARVDEKDPHTIYDSDFVVTSNRVGFFFSGAKNKPPLVNVGDHVDFNQPVCIIEQLGQQYVYLSEASGTVLKIFIEDGDAVEYGQNVMVIRPD